MLDLDIKASTNTSSRASVASLFVVAQPPSCVSARDHRPSNIGTTADDDSSSFPPSLEYTVRYPACRTLVGVATSAAPIPTLFSTCFTCVFGTWACACPERRLGQSRTGHQQIYRYASDPVGSLAFVLDHRDLDLVSFDGRCESQQKCLACRATHTKFAVVACCGVCKRNTNR